MATIYKYNAHFNSTQTEYTESSEQWGSWSSSHENSFSDIEKVTTEYADIYSEIDLDKTKAYLVWAEYSTGNSFGTSTRSQIEIIKLLSSEQDALTLKSYLLKKNEAYKNGRYHTGDFKVADTVFIEGKSQKIYTPWEGWFETLEDIHVQEVGLLGDKDETM